ncbi:NfeD family protein [Lysinimonas soli]|uniref:NfeD family protein n=1 Tax=Lysinimonas soli TaxID=1074233 RepID=A0ABW0NPH8_9MICO
MQPDVLTSWAWVFWLALILVFLVIEVLSLSFVFLMLAVGSLGGLIAGLLGVPWYFEFVVAAVLSLLLLFFVRPPLLRLTHRGADPTRSNIPALIGTSATVVIAFDEGRGQVKLANGETWTARLADGVSAAPIEGDRLQVDAIDGATAVVSPPSAPSTSTEKSAP